MKMGRSELPTAARPTRIGAVLVELGLMTEGDIPRVLKLQASRPMRFGEAAVQMGLVREHDVQFALAKQFEFPYVHRDSSPLAASGALPSAIRPFDAAADQMRAIRSRLLISWLDKAARRNALAVVSANRGEGRSHVAANLAVVFAQAGASTLLIDADMRQPAQHQFFGQQNDPGLAGFLVGRHRSEPILRIDELPSLYLLPAGVQPPSPVELLLRPAWKALVRDAKATFDVVIVDTPPMSSCDDALMASAGCGAVIAVASQHRTRIKPFESMLMSMRHIGIEVVGTVLNHVPGVRP